MSNNPSEIPFTHVIQKTGLLRSFRVAQVVTAAEIGNLKQLLRAAASSEEEYEKMLETELANIGQFDYVPGMIFAGGDAIMSEKLSKLSTSYVKKIKKDNLNKSQMCFLINSIVDDLGLEPSDFEQLNDELFGPDEED
jgi:hypothetical protein